MRFVVVVVLILVINNVTAASLYKCQTKDGTTIYQNDPCPQGSAPVAKGNYERQPDDTRTNRSAMEYSDQEHERLEYNAAVAAQQRAGQAAFDSQSPSMSSTAAWNAQVEANSYESRIGHDGPVRTKGEAAAARERAAQALTDDQIGTPVLRGGVDQYGTYYAPAGPNGVINTQTGQFMPKAGDAGYIDPTTGQLTPVH